MHRDWAPLGADRFYNLVKNGFYDDVRFFRVLADFMAQFGINGNPAVQAAWHRAPTGRSGDEASNKRGYVTFAHDRAPTPRHDADLHQLQGQRARSTSRASRRSAR